MAAHSGPEGEGIVSLDPSKPGINPVAKAFGTDEAKAYNYSIYLMVGMPYLLFGGFGLMIYRGIKSAQKKTQVEDTLAGHNVVRK